MSTHPRFTAYNRNGLEMVIKEAKNGSLNSSILSANGAEYNMLGEVERPDGSITDTAELIAIPDNVELCPDYWGKYYDEAIAEVGQILSDMRSVFANGGRISIEWC